MPELPDARRRRFVEEYGLSEYDARILVETRAKGDFFEKALSLNTADTAKRAKAVANWMNGDLARLLNAGGLEIQDCRVTPEGLSELIDLQEDGTLSGKTAKGVFEEMFQSGRPPREIVEKAGLVQITSGDEIGEAVQKVIAENAKPVQDYRGGKEEAIKFLVGQVMRETRGRARPDIVLQALREKLRETP
ncbi:MAG: hypothetical protein ACRD1T_12310 [Acidimicrobiia bacterium]